MQAEFGAYVVYGGVEAGVNCWDEVGRVGGCLKVGRCDGLKVR